MFNHHILQEEVSKMRLNKCNDNRFSLKLNIVTDYLKKEWETLGTVIFFFFTKLSV